MRLSLCLLMLSCAGGVQAGSRPVQVEPPRAGSVLIVSGSDIGLPIIPEVEHIGPPSGGQIQVGGGSIVVNNQEPVVLTPGVVSAVPEPQTWALLLGGLLALGGVVARRGGAARQR